MLTLFSFPHREYPGTQGDSANVVSSSDTANLLLFLQALRTALPNTRLSTCTTQQTYVGANGNPIGDVSAYAALLDNILVMNYDVWGGTSSFPPPFRQSVN
jgi:GH18 family chitinase